MHIFSTGKYIKDKVVTIDGERILNVGGVVPIDSQIIDAKVQP